MCVCVCVCVRERERERIHSAKPYLREELFRGDWSLLVLNGTPFFFCCFYVANSLALVASFFLALRPHWVQVFRLFCVGASSVTRWGEIFATLAKLWRVWWKFWNVYFASGKRWNLIVQIFMVLGKFSCWIFSIGQILKRPFGHTRRSDPSLVRVRERGQVQAVQSVTRFGKNWPLW